MQKYHGYRYFDWKLNGGALELRERNAFGEKKIEGRYVIMTSEKELSVLDAVALYKELTDVESGFRQLKDVLAMRPIYRRIEPRVGPSSSRRSRCSSKDFWADGSKRRESICPAVAMEALSTVWLVIFRLEGQPEQRGVTGGCPDARLVLKALKLVDQRPPAPPEGEDTVM